MVAGVPWPAHRRAHPPPRHGPQRREPTRTRRSTPTRSTAASPTQVPPSAPASRCCARCARARPWPRPGSSCPMASRRKAMACTRCSSTVPCSCAPLPPGSAASRRPACSCRWAPTASWWPRRRPAACTRAPAWRPARPRSRPPWCCRWPTVPSCCVWRACASHRPTPAPRPRPKICCTTCTGRPCRPPRRANPLPAAGCCWATGAAWAVPWLRDSSSRARTAPRCARATHSTPWPRGPGAAWCTSGPWTRRRSPMPRRRTPPTRTGPRWAVRSRSRRRWSSSPRRCFW